MLLADVARTSRQVAAASARKEKMPRSPRLFRRADRTRSPVVITYLAGTAAAAPHRRGLDRSLSERHPAARRRAV